MSSCQRLAGRKDWLNRSKKEPVQMTEMCHILTAVVPVRGLPINLIKLQNRCISWCVYYTSVNTSFSDRSLLHSCIFHSINIGSEEKERRGTP